MIPKRSQKDPQKNPKGTPSDPKTSSKRSENSPKWVPSDPKGAAKPPKELPWSLLETPREPVGPTLRASTAKVNCEGKTSKLAKAFVKN